MANFVFWLFQVINGLTALGMFISPRRFHESMFQNPQKAYQTLGFSPLAVEMLHNVIRGQGASLLAISVYLFAQGVAQPNSFLLISLTCGFAFIAHVLTALHHIKSPTVMKAIGSLKSMYGILGINLIVGSLALYVSSIS